MPGLAALTGSHQRELGGTNMVRFLRITAAVFVASGCALASLEVGAAKAACQLITATHSAASKAEAAQTSRALAVHSRIALRLGATQAEHAIFGALPVLEVDGQTLAMWASAPISI